MDTDILNLEGKNMQVYQWEMSSVRLISSYRGKIAPVDWMMYALSSKLIGGIIIILAAFFFLKRKGIRETLHFSIPIITSFVMADLFSRFLFKDIFHRARPLYFDQICNTSNCYGFVSSHASDIFAFAVVVSLLNKKNLIWSFSLAFLVCLSRIYREAHYPLDTIGGALLGIFIGVVCYFVYNFEYLQKVVSNLIAKVENSLLSRNLFRKFFK